MTSGVAKETSPPVECGGVKSRASTSTSPPGGVSTTSQGGVFKTPATTTTTSDDTTVFAWSCGERLSCHVDFADAGPGHEDDDDDDDMDTPLKSGRVSLCIVDYLLYIFICKGYLLLMERYY